MRKAESDDAIFLYMKDRLPQNHSNKTASYLEQIACLQAKWTSESFETRETYRLRAREHN